MRTSYLSMLGIGSLNACSPSEPFLGQVRRNVVWRPGISKHPDCGMRVNPDAPFLEDVRKRDFSVLNKTWENMKGLPFLPFSGFRTGSFGAEHNYPLVGS